MKKEKIILIIISISIVFMAWWPIKPSTTLADKNIKGPVEIIIENLKAMDANNIVVQKYNHVGQLTELRFFMPREELCTDTFLLRITNNPNYKVFVNPKYRGIDTNEFVYSYKELLEYNDKSKIISRVTILNQGILFSKDTYNYDFNDSLISKMELFYDSLERVIYSSLTSYDYVKYDTYNQKSTIIDSDTFIVESYYSQSNIIKIKSYFKSKPNKFHVASYTYNDIKCLIKEYVYSINDTGLKEIKREVNYLYNLDNKLIHKENKEYLEGNFFLKTTTDFVYESQILRKIIKTSKSIYSKVESQSKSVSFYNENDDVESSIQYNDDDTIAWKWDYKYDNFGNWISLSSFKNGIKEDSVSRVIIYNTENRK